jgi:hypothetical protein
MEANRVSVQNPGGQSPLQFLTIITGFEIGGRARLVTKPAYFILNSFDGGERVYFMGGTKRNGVWLSNLKRWGMLFKQFENWEGRIGAGKGI